MKQKHWKFLLLGLILAGITPHQNANALSCAATSLRDQYNAADLIYVGYVQEIKYTVDDKPLTNVAAPSSGLPNSSWRNARFRATLVPEEVFKGTPSKTPTLTAESFFPEWGDWMTEEEAVQQSMPFSWFTSEIKPGARYLVYQTAGTRSSLGGCSPNQILPAQYESPTLKRLRRFRDRASS